MDGFDVSAFCRSGSWFFGGQFLAFWGCVGGERFVFCFLTLVAEELELEN